MKVPTNHDRIQVLAAAVLASLAVPVAWSASAGASAYTVSGSAIRPSPDSASQTQPTGQDRGTLWENPPVVTNEAAPSTDGNTGTLPIVLSSAALLVALGGVGFTVLASGRERGAPQPDA